jgi:ketosteroid isomerase-like protein
MQNNEQIFRTGYAAFGQGDLATLEKLFAADAVWYEPGASPISGAYKGWPEIAQLFMTYAERSNGTFKAELHDVLANDQVAFSIATVTGERNGRRLNQGDHVLGTIRDGKITEMRVFYHDQRAVDEFWQ